MVVLCSRRHHWHLLRTAAHGTRPAASAIVEQRSKPAAGTTPAAGLQLAVAAAAATLGTPDGLGREHDVRVACSAAQDVAHSKPARVHDRDEVGEAVALDE